MIGRMFLYCFVQLYLLNKVFFMVMYCFHTSGHYSGRGHFPWFRLQSAGRSPLALSRTLGVAGLDSVLVLAEGLEGVAGVNELQRPIGPDEDQELLLCFYWSPAKKEGLSGLKRLLIYYNILYSTK